METVTAVVDKNENRKKIVLLIGALTGLLIADYIFEDKLTKK